MTSRRKFFKAIGAGAAGIGLASVFPISACTAKNQTDQSADDEQKLFVGDEIAIANTQYGKVQGFILNDIFNSGASHMVLIHRVKTVSCQRNHPKHGMVSDPPSGGEILPHRI